jgi:succinylarginine dihydrolase
MWTANAATVAPSCDSVDGLVHLTPANLQQMFHRALEADTTERVLRSIFADDNRFAVHAPLPGGGQFADEGAANHTRLATSRGFVHLLAWGRRSWGEAAAPTRFPARQTREASEALARLHRLPAGRALFPQQDPRGIDAGAFHTDVLAVGNQRFLMLHELAFVDAPALVKQLRELLGDDLRVELATEVELPVASAVKAYPFNSQVISLSHGGMAIVAPEDSQQEPAAKRFLDRVVAGDNPVSKVHYLDLKQSMNNGGGPACLRQRIPLTEPEIAAIKANVFLTDTLYADLEAWVKKHYRDRLLPADLADPALAREGMTALDELTQLLRLGSIYDFQLTRAP